MENVLVTFGAVIATVLGGVLAANMFGDGWVRIAPFIEAMIGACIVARVVDRVRWPPALHLP